MNQQFTVAVSREGSWWVGNVREVPGGATEVRHLADLEIEVRDLLSGLLDIGEDEFDLYWDLSAILGSEGQATWQSYQQERDDIAARQKKLAADRVATLTLMREAGVSLRDSATLTGLSHQRVAQLLAG